MIRAFILKLDIEPTELLADLAVDIEDALDKQGFPVESVTPWKGHGMMGDATPPLPLTPTTPPPAP